MNHKFTIHAAITNLFIYSYPRLMRNWRWNFYISNLTNFEFTDFIDFMHNKGKWSKLIRDKRQFCIFSVFLKYVDNLFRFLSQLFISCALYLSTSWCVSFLLIFCYNVFFADFLYFFNLEFAVFGLNLPFFNKEK